MSHVSQHSVTRLGAIAARRLALGARGPCRLPEETARAPSRSPVKVMWWRPRLRRPRWFSPGSVKARTESTLGSASPARSRARGQYRRTMSRQGRCSPARCTDLVLSRAARAALASAKTRRGRRAERVRPEPDAARRASSPVGPRPAPARLDQATAALTPRNPPATRPPTRQPMPN